MELTHTVSKEDTLKTVKYILKQRMGLSERLVKKLKYSSLLFCNNNPVFVNKIVEEGDIILARIELEDVNEEIVPEDIPIDILFEDEGLLVINKPSNTVVHPTWNHQSGTIANAVSYYLRSKGIKTLIRPVSRLDRDTTGIIVFALNQYVQESLIRQMKDHTFEKEYIGIVSGSVENDAGTIDLPIERKPDSIMLRHTSPAGAPSVTHYHVLERLKGSTLLKFRLETGRTHQIRVHCQASGHPLLGDTLYPSLEASENNLPESDNTIINRQALHSRSVAFTNPLTGERQIIDAPIPEDIRNALSYLKINST
ncbi:MAG: RluA family pseudouridine synthase [Clostridiales bacterium]|nr:RluA family pseudouridine synthase [Clostridiales bacterium]